MQGYWTSRRIVVLRRACATSPSVAPMAEAHHGRKKRLMLHPNPAGSCQNQLFCKAFFQCGLSREERGSESLIPEMGLSLRTTYYVLRIAYCVLRITYPQQPMSLPFRQPVFDHKGFGGRRVSSIRTLERIGRSISLNKERYRGKAWSSVDPFFSSFQAHEFLYLGNLSTDAYLSNGRAMEDCLKNQSAALIVMTPGDVCGKARQRGVRCRLTGFS